MGHDDQDFKLKKRHYFVRIKEMLCFFFFSSGRHSQKPHFQVSKSTSKCQSEKVIWYKIFNEDSNYSKKGIFWRTLRQNSPRLPTSDDYGIPCFCITAKGLVKK